MPPLNPRWGAAIASLAVVLALFAIFRIDLAGSPVISFRHERWQSQQALRLSAPLAPQPFGPSPLNLANLYALYATYAAGAEVQKLVLRDGPLHGTYRAFAEIIRVRESGTACQKPSLFISCSSEGEPSPPIHAVLKIEGTARTRANASSIASRVSWGLQRFVLQQQEASRIPMSHRVQILVAAPAAMNVTQVQGRRLLGPLVALSVVLVLLALALVSARAGKTRP